MKRLDWINNYYIKTYSYSNSSHWIHSGGPTSTPSDLFLKGVDRAKESVRNSSVWKTIFSKHSLVHDEWRHRCSSNKILIHRTQTLNFRLQMYSYPNHLKKIRSSSDSETSDWLCILFLWTSFFIRHLVSFGSSSWSLSCTICTCKIEVSRGFIFLYHLSNGLSSQLTDIHP
jgi:hypothetical protein